MLALVVAANILFRGIQRIFPGKASAAAGKSLHHIFQSVQFQIGKGVRSDDLTDLLHRSVISDQLFPGRHIRTEVARIQKWRRADSHVYLCGSRIPKHLHDPVTGGSTDDGIIDHDHTFSIYRFFQNI